MSYLHIVVGVLIGIMIVSILKNGEINWILIGKTFALSVILLFSLLLIRVGTKRVNNA